MHYSCHFHIISELCACGYQPQGSHVFTPLVVNQTQNDNLQSKSHLLTHCDHRLPSTEIDFFNYTSIRQTRAHRECNFPQRAMAIIKPSCFMIFYYNMLMSVCFGVIVVLYGGVSKNFKSVLHSFLNALFKWYLTRYHFLVFFSRSRLTLLLIN